MRLLIMVLGTLSLFGCATSGASTSAVQTKANCCATAKAEGSNCKACVANKTDCCAKAKAQGQSCTQCATPTDCCAQAKADGKACAKCAT